MIKRFLIRWLLRIVTPELQIREVNVKAVDQWLDAQGGDPRYVEYFRLRDITLLKTMGTCQEREEYLISVGRRLELLTLAQKVDVAHKTMEAKREEQRKTDKKRAEEQANKPTINAEKQ